MADVPAKLRHRVDSAALWAGLNPILLRGELGFEEDTLGMKLGDGVTAWNDLPYRVDPGAVSPPPPPPPTAPSITTQPAAQSVTEPAAATFTVSASGTAPLAYQWRKNGVAISGATSANYTTPATTTADSGASYTVVVTNAAGSVTSSAASLTVAAAPPAPSVPGAPTGLTLGTATSTTQPLTWTAPGSNGGAAITDYVVQYAPAGSGSWTTFADGTSAGTSATVTGLTASTGYDYRVATVNSAGAGAYSSTATGSTAAAAPPPPDSRARFGYGSATAGVDDPAALLASMTVYGATNASKAGTFTSAPPAGQYVWAAFESGVSASGVTFSVTLGPGGWQGASSPGPNFDDDGSSPNTSTVTAVISGVTWRFFRTSFANAADTWTTS